MFMSHTKQWTKVSLYGSGQIIPRVCPNCLGPGQLELRHTCGRVSQSFYCCEGCVESALGENRLGGWLDLLSGLIYFMVTLNIFMSVSVCSVVIPLMNQHVGWIVAGVFSSMLLGLILATMTHSCIERWCWRRIAARHPLRSGQAIWGHAVMCTRAPATHEGWSEYKAVRPEWIKRLVMENPTQVHDNTYLHVVGVSKLYQAQPS